MHSVLVQHSWETPTGDDEKGGGGGDSDNWYLGSVPSFRANAAFSLYGILKGDEDKGCGKQTFINSFHTTRGIEAFTNAMAAAGLTDLFELVEEEQGNDDNIDVITSTCYDNEGGDNNGDDSVANGDKLYGGASSYGVGCTARSSKKHPTFAIHTYEGGICDANAIVETVDTLDDFNSKLDMSKCVPIYTNGDYYAGANNNGGNKEDSSSPLAILENSRACRLHDGTGSCPDPYGRLKQYERALQKATHAREESPFWTAERVMKTGWSFIGFGIGMFLLGMILVAVDLCLPSNSSTSTGNKNVEEGARSLERSATTQRNFSKALTAVSELSRAASRSLGLSTSSKTSKRSSKSKRSRRSSTGDKPPRSSRSLHTAESKPPHSSKSLVTTKSNKSNRSSRSHGTSSSTQLDKEIVMQPTRSIQSEVSNGSHVSVTETDAQKDTIESEGGSVASAGGGIDHLVRNKSEELFRDEEYGDDFKDDESVEVNLPPGIRAFNLPPVTPDAPDDTDDVEVTRQEEQASKKKYRRRRWFKKIVGGN